jgi:hypothetical protein
MKWSFGSKFQPQLPERFQIPDHNGLAVHEPNVHVGIALPAENSRSKPCLVGGIEVTMIDVITESVAK